MRFQPMSFSAMVQLADVQLAEAKTNKTHTQTGSFQAAINYDIR
jgi:hypothetical protein